MSYDLHIRRIGQALTAAEFRAYIASDPDLQLDPIVEADGHVETTSKDGSVLRVMSEGVAAWPSLHEPKAWFHFRRGKITVRNPDDDTIKKMKEVADRLSAVVEGDDGERY